MKIGRFDTRDRILIVAEIGNNHEGSLETARMLVDRAADCGVDAVKFQTYRTEDFVHRRDEGRFARLKSYELGAGDLADLAAQARRRGLLFLSTPLDLESVTILDPLVDAYKVASGDVTFEPLLRAIAATERPVILSSGASTIEEIERAADVVRSAWSRRGVRQELAVLHCVSSYPAPEAEANLAAIAAIAAACGATAGYSDHVVGIEAAAASAAAGARIIEKHFTLDRRFSDFRDHALSADPDDLRELVTRIRRIEAMLGSGSKTVQPSEAPLRDAIRRSAVLVADRSAGHRLTADDLRWMRPAGGIGPRDEAVLIGRRLSHPMRAGDRLLPTDVE